MSAMLPHHHVIVKPDKTRQWTMFQWPNKNGIFRRQNRDDWLNESAIISLPSEENTVRSVCKISQLFTSADETGTDAIHADNRSENSFLIVNVELFKIFSSNFGFP